MTRGTTPEYILTVPGYDLTQTTVYCTISQWAKKLTLTGDRLSIAYDNTASTVAFSLTQEETLKMRVGAAEVQIRFIDSAGHARATEIKPLAVNRVLLEKVIDYAE